MSNPEYYNSYAGEGYYNTSNSNLPQQYSTDNAMPASSTSNFSESISAVDYFVLAEDPQVAASNRKKNEAAGSYSSSASSVYNSYSTSSSTKGYNLRYHSETNMEYVPQHVATFGGTCDSYDDEDLTKSKAKTIPYVPKSLYASVGTAEHAEYVPGGLKNALADDTDTPFAPYVSEPLRKEVFTLAEKKKPQINFKEGSSLTKLPPTSSGTKSLPNKVNPLVKDLPNLPKPTIVPPPPKPVIHYDLPATLSSKRPSSSSTDLQSDEPGTKSARVAHKPSYDAALVKNPINRRKKPTRTSLRQLMVERYEKMKATSEASNDDQNNAPKEQLKAQPSKSTFETSTKRSPSTLTPLIVHTKTPPKTPPKTSPKSTSPNVTSSSSSGNSRLSGNPITAFTPITDLIQPNSLTFEAPSPKPSAKPLSAKTSTTTPTKILKSLSTGTPIQHQISTAPQAAKTIVVASKNLPLSKIISHQKTFVVKEKPAIPTPSTASRFTVGNRDKSGARVAHVPKPLDAKKAAQLGITISTFSSSTSNSAHLATLSKLLMPIADSSARVPLSIRRSTLLKIRSELISVHSGSSSSSSISADQLEKLSAEAQSLEKEIAVRAKNNRNIYVSLGASKVATIRREAKEGSSTTSTTFGSSTTSMSTSVKKAGKKYKQLASTAPEKPLPKISHDDLLKFNAKNCSTLVRESARVADLTRPELVYQLGKLILPVEELEKYGFPRPVTENGVVISGKAHLPNVTSKSKPTVYTEGVRMTCRRCRAVYTNPQSTSGGSMACIYHEGRVFKFRDRQGVEGKYTCCKGDREAAGCSSSPAHVTDGLEFADAFEGFTSTLPGGASGKVDPNVFALDCEMCYTDRNLALSRVTLLNFEGNVVYDSLVKPPGVIHDYNTKFSGIKEGDLDGVTTTLADVQEELRSRVAAESILIGHGLDSDFRALKLFHDRVVDTTYLYPHRQGLPMKRSLRMLASNFLNRIIQDSEEGHDSNEDAKAALELVKLKLQEELNKFLIN